MDGDSSSEKAITVRCSREFKTLVKFAAVANDENLSDYIRRVLREDASDVLSPEAVAEAQRQARNDDSTSEIEA